MVSRRAPSPPGSLTGQGLNDLVAGIREARRSVCVATPFMTADVGRRLARAAIESGAKELRLLTALNVAAVENGYLDPAGVHAFADAGFEVRSLRNLHAKVVLCDRRWGLIGSGNLTKAGSDGGNAELGIVLDAAQSRNARTKHFDAWWNAAEPLDFRYLNRIKRRKPANDQRRRREGQGGLFRVPSEPVLDSFKGNRDGYWLKLVYGTGMGGDDLWDSPWISDHDRPKRDGSPGGRTPGYKIDDHIVIYVTRGSHERCPAIVRVTALPQLDPARVERESSREDALQWPWLTEVALVHRVPLRSGPTLSDIDVATTSIRQHDHITLSGEQYQRALHAIRG